MFGSNKKTEKPEVKVAAPVVEAKPVVAPAPASVEENKAHVAAAAPAKPAEPEVLRPSSGCLLSAGTTFVGNINTTDNVTVAGNYEGELVSTNNIIILGTVKGNVTGKCIELRGKIEGDITVSENLNVSERGSVNGNIRAGKVNLQKDTSVTGDIVAGSVHMDEGATIHGKMDIDSKQSI